MFIVPFGGQLTARVGLRYPWDFGGRHGTDGETFMVMATFPLPSLPLQ